MKKHDSPNAPNGRDGRDPYDSRNRTGSTPQSRSGLSGDGRRDRAPLSVDRGRSSRSGQSRSSRLIGFLVFAAVLLAAFFALRPLAAGFLGGSTTTTTRATTMPASSAAPTPGVTAAASSGTGASGSATTAATSATVPAATVDAAARAQAFAAAKSEFETLVKTYKGRYALYYRNLVNNETYAYNATQPFVAASSIKLGINTYLYTQIEAGKISATEMLAYDSRPYPTGDYEAGTGTIQGQPNGTKYSVRDTSGLSIRISDNCGTNMVIRKLGGIDTVNGYLSGISAVVDYRKSVSYKNYSNTSVSGRHRTSATDLGLHAVNLYGLYRKNQALYGTLIDDLKKTEFDFGIQKGIPAGIGVAHKIGTNGTYNTENDVGIVFAPEPFVLAVMSESSNAGTAHQFQAKAAQIFYNYIDKIT